MLTEKYCAQLNKLTSTWTDKSYNKTLSNHQMLSAGALHNHLKERACRFLYIAVHGVEDADRI